MSNTFITTDLVAREAAIILQNIMVAANLVNRSQEENFADKVGDTVEVKVPPIMTARDFIDDSGTTQDTDITETSVDLQILRKPYIKVPLSSAEQTLELDDFNVVVTEPAVIGIKDAIDAFIHQQAAKGFAPNLVGTDGTNPSSKAHIAAGRKKLMDIKCPPDLRRSFLSTTAAASFLQLSEFTDADFGVNNPPALTEGQLTRKYGIDWWESQNSQPIAIGTDTAGTVLTDGTPVLGASIVHLDGFTAATGTVVRGTRFTVAGDTTVYTVTADSAIASNEGDIAITPTVTADLVTAADGAAVTFKTAATGDVMFHRDAITAAVVAPTPLMGTESSVAFFDGVGIRVTMDGTVTTMSSSIVFDTFLACEVTQVNGGCIFQG